MICGCWGPTAGCPKSRWWPRETAGRCPARRRSWPRPVCRRARNHRKGRSNNRRSRPRRRTRKRRQRLRANRFSVGRACRRRCRCRRRNRDGIGGTEASCCCCDCDNAVTLSSYDGVTTCATVTTTMPSHER